MALATVSNIGGNWSSTSAWVSSSVPVNGDYVVFTSTSGNLLVDVSTANIGIDFSNYAATITFDNNINVRDYVSLGAGGYTQSGSFGLNINRAETILLSNGVTWSRTLTFTGVNAQSYTMSSNWINTGNVVFSTGTGHTLRSSNLFIKGNLIINTGGIIDGTTKFVLSGDTTWSAPGGGSVRVPMDINSTGTVSISGTVIYATETLRYITAATVSTTGSTLTIPNLGGTILDTAPIMWNNINFSSGTLTSDLNMRGNFTNYLDAGAQFTGVGRSVFIGGNLTQTNQIFGDVTLVLNGTGSQTWSQNGGVTTYLRTGLTINKPSGNFIVSGIVRYTQAGKTINYISADDAITTGSTLQIEADTTLNTSGMTWSNITLTGGSAIVLTLSSDLNISGTLTTQTSAVTINGSGRFVNVKGNLTTSVTTSGSATIVLLGTGSQTWTSAAYLLNSLRIDKPSGTLSLSSNTYYQTGTLSYISGSVSTSGNTLNIGGSCGLSTNGIIWNNISAGLNFTNPTIILSSNFTWSGLMSLINNQLGVSGATRTVTFSGSSLTSLPTANIDIGNTGFGSNGGASVINFPSSTVLSITNLTIGCGGFSSGAYNTTVNNVTFNISGNLTLNTQNPGFGAPRFNGASSQINMVGNGTITNNRIGGTSIYIAIPTFTINTPNTVTFSSNDANTFYFESSTITYTSGTLTGATCVFITSTLNLNTGGKWGTDVVIRGNTTLTSNATFGNLTTNTNNVGLTGAFTINVEGNLAINVATSGASAPIIINGTGAQLWSHVSAVYLSNNLSINKPSGTFSVSGNVYYQTGTFSFASGNYSTTGSTLNLGSSCTVDSNGIIWNNVTNTTSAIINLPSDMNWTGLWSVTGGTLTFSGIGTLTASSTGNVLMNGSSTTFLKNDIQVVNATLGPATLNRNNINITGNLSVNGTTTGTSSLVIMGTSSQTWTATSYLSNNLTINKPSGTFSVSGAVYYQTGTMSYISGSVSTVGSSLTIGSSCTLNTNPISWNNLNVETSGTVLLNTPSNLNIGGTFRMSGLSGAITLSFTGPGLFNPSGAFSFGDFNVNSGPLLIRVNLPNNITVSSFYYYAGGGVGRSRSLEISGNRIVSISGSLTFDSGGGDGTLSGNSTLRAIGSGTIQCKNAASPIYGPALSPKLEIAASGTYNFTNFPYFVNATIIYTSGTVSGAGIGNPGYGAAFIFSNCTFDMNASGRYWGQTPTLTNQGFTLYTYLEGTSTLMSTASFTNLATTSGLQVNANVLISGTGSVNVGGDLQINRLTSGKPIIINGTGSQTWTATSYLDNNFTINKNSGTLSVSGNVYYQTGTMSYVSGTVSALNSTLNIGGSTNLQTEPIQWFNINNPAAATVNLVNNLSFTGTWSAAAGVISYTGSGILSPTSSSRINFSGTSNVTVPDSVNGITISSITLTTSGTTQLRGTISCSGLLTLGGSGAINNASGFTGFIRTGGGLSMAGNASGTATIVLVGGTWSASGANYLSNNLRLDGNSTISGNVYYQSGTLSYVSGVVSATNSTLNLGSSCVVDSNGLTWSNITNTTTATVTLPTNLLWIGTYSVTSGTINFSGAGSLSASTTGNVNFSSSIINLKNNIQVVNATFDAATVNSASMSLSGNLNLLGSSNPAIGGSSTIIFNGTSNQTWSHTTARYITAAVKIDKSSGVLILGSSVYLNGRLTFINGSVDSTTNLNTFYTEQNATLFSTNLMTFWNFSFEGSTINMNIPDTYIQNQLTFNFSGSNSINGGRIYTSSLNYTNFGLISGTSVIVFNGSGTWRNTISRSVGLSVDINCNSLQLIGSIQFSGATFSYTKGKVVTTNSTLILDGNNSTLINMNKVAYNVVQITSGNNIRMNEFFSGLPNYKTSILASSTGAYSVTFTDNFEKVAKHVNPTNLTLARPMQLLFTTDSKKSSTNRGIRHINSLPNGLAKRGNPETPAALGTFLYTDPTRVRNI